MRIQELHIDKIAKNKLKEMYPHLTEQQLDEIAPLAALAPMAAGAARVGAAGAKVAGKVGVQAAKMGAKAAGQVGKAGMRAAGQVGKTMGKQAVSSVGNKLASKLAVKANANMANKLLKPGATLPIAGNDMKVDAVKGNEVTIADPKNSKAPKVVLQKDSPEVKTGIQTLTQRVL